MHFMWQNWHELKQKMILFSLICSIYTKGRIIVDEQTMRFETRLPPFTSFGPTKTEQNEKPTSDTTVKVTCTRTLQNRFLSSLDYVLCTWNYFMCVNCLFKKKKKNKIVKYFKHFNVEVFNLLLIICLKKSSN